jgi:hypothetical protein
MASSSSEIKALHNQIVKSISQSGIKAKIIARENEENQQVSILGQVLLHSVKQLGVILRPNFMELKPKNRNTSEMSHRERERKRERKKKKHGHVEKKCEC